MARTVSFPCKGQRHHIHHCPAGIDNPDLERADFIFIDPPGIRSTKYPDFPDWDFFQTFIMKYPHTDMLLWLPLYTDPHSQTGESQKAIEFRENLMLFGNLQATSVQWLTQGEIVGCQLYYRLGAESVYYLQQALEHLVHLMGWDLDDRKSILHYSDRSTLPSGTAVQCDDGIERYVITHQEAIEGDLEYYFTGIECRKGHMCERRIDDCRCTACLNGKERTTPMWRAVPIVGRFATEHMKRGWLCLLHGKGYYFFLQQHIPEGEITTYGNLSEVMFGGSGSAPAVVAMLNAAGRSNPSNILWTNRVV